MSNESSSRTSKPLTRAEARDLFLRNCVSTLEYWAGEDGSNVPEERTTKERMEGLLFSLLVSLDGGSMGVPGYYLIPSVDESDPEYSKDEGIDWHPYFDQELLPEGIYDIGGALHEEIGRYLNHEVPRPAGTFTFADKMALDAQKMHEENPVLARLGDFTDIDAKVGDTRGTCKHCGVKNAVIMSHTEPDHKCDPELIGLHKHFTNIGKDEDGNVLGNCKWCNTTGTKVLEHECEGQKRNGS